MPGQHLRHRGFGKMAHRGNIGGVIHLPGEHDMGPLPVKRRFARHRGRIERLRIDAVAQHSQVHPSRISQPLREKIALCRRNQQRHIGAARHLLFKGRQHPRFARMDRAHPPRPCRRGIGGIFGRIDVDKIHHHPAAKILGHILRHLPRKHDDHLDLAPGNRGTDPAVQPPRPECDQADRPARDQRRDPRPAQRSRPRGKAMAGGDPGQCFDKRPIGHRLDQTAAMDIRPRRQRAQQVPRTDAITAIRRIGHAVRQKQHFGPALLHRFRPDPPQSTAPAGWPAPAADVATARSGHGISD